MQTMRKLCAIVPQGAHCFDAQGHHINLQLCIGCEKLEQCASCCPVEAMMVCGREYTPEELVSLLARDRIFYGEDGGVTFPAVKRCCRRNFRYIA